MRSGGIPPGISDHVVLLPFNDLDAIRQALWLHGHEIAAVILEPIHYNAGCIVPSQEYLQGLRRLTSEYGVVLIYEEILLAFRIGSGCAQAYFDVVPDLCTIGKCVAGGMPLSVFGGRRAIMEHLRPLGNAEHSGTYNAHLENLANRLCAGMNVIFEKYGFWSVARAWERALACILAFGIRCTAIRIRAGRTRNSPSGSLLG